MIDKKTADGRESVTYSVNVDRIGLGAPACKTGQTQVRVRRKNDVLEVEAVVLECRTDQQTALQGKRRGREIRTS